MLQKQHSHALLAVGASGRELGTEDSDISNHTRVGNGILKARYPAFCSHTPR